jgi:uncharacterized protein (DUF1697 family)
VARYAAFLRGINVGGRRVKNDALRECFEGMGFEGVAIFRASGNVIFEAPGEATDELAERIEAGIEKDLGFSSRAFLRNARQIRAIAANEPFTKRQLDASKGKVQVSLLAEKPSKATRDEVLELASDDDLLAFSGRELYWLPKGGTQESTLGQERLAELFGTATMRTQGTIQAIAAKYFD